MLRTLHRRRKLVIAALIGSIGIILLVIAAFNLREYYSITHSGPDYPSSDTITDTATISEKPVVVSDSGYVVPVGQPRTIEISALGVKSYIQRVGIDRDGVMATPNNIYFAGWYTKNPVPGEEGLSIINGHAGGRYTAGLFNHLGDLNKDDTIRIQMGDLSWREFSIVLVKSYSVKDAAAPLFARTPGITHELHLITCDGAFDDASQTYDSRTIVVAKYVQ